MDRSEKRATLGMAPGYAQQDAEECYAAIINSLRNVPGLNAEGKVASSSAQADVGARRFVAQYMLGSMRREMTCDEAPDELKAVQEESVLKEDTFFGLTTDHPVAMPCYRAAEDTVTLANLAQDKDGGKLSVVAERSFMFEPNGCI